MTTAGDEVRDGGAAAAWRGTNVAVRVGLVALAAVLAVEYGASLYGGVVGTRTVPGVPTSPFDTGPSGTAAFVRLLSLRGDRVVLSTATLTATTVPRGATLLEIDARRWTAQDRTVAASVTAAGGRVVFVGTAPRAPGPALPADVRVALGRGAAGDVAASSGRLGVGVSSLVTGAGALLTTAAVRRDVVGDGGVFAARSGAVAWVASSAPLRNANLARRDDAALAWNLARPWGGTVVIDVAAMTPGARSSGLRALPAWWQAALVVLGLAALCWIVSASRRFGPPDPTPRPLAPARVGYVDAMATLLGTLPDAEVPAATVAVSGAAARALRRRLRLGPDAGPTEIGKDAAEHEIPPWVVDAATTAPATRADAVRVGQALAWLTDEEAPR